MVIDSKVGKHSLLEDVFAYVVAAVLVTLGIALYSAAQLPTGGMAGLSLLTHYVTGWEFGTVFFVLNLPFYVLAVVRLGWDFTLRTFLAVTLVSTFSRFVPGLIAFQNLDTIYAVVAGASSMGVGILIFFRHKASLGGFNILATFLQARFGLSAGIVLLGIDLAIMLLSFAVLDWRKVLVSILGAVIMGLIITINHRPGRYTGMS